MAEHRSFDSSVFSSSSIFSAFRFRLHLFRWYMRYSINNGVLGSRSPVFLFCLYWNCQRGVNLFRANDFLHWFLCYPCSALFDCGYSWLKEPGLCPLPEVQLSEEWPSLGLTISSADVFVISAQLCLIVVTCVFMLLSIAVNWIPLHKCSWSFV